MDYNYFYSPTQNFSNGYEYQFDGSCSQNVPTQDTSHEYQEEPYYHQYWKNNQYNSFNGYSENNQYNSFSEYSENNEYNYSSGYYNVEECDKSNQITQELLLQLSDALTRLNSSFDRYLEAHSQRSLEEINNQPIENESNSLIDEPEYVKPIHFEGLEPIIPTINFPIFGPTYDLPISPTQDDSYLEEDYTKPEEPPRLDLNTSPILGENLGELESVRENFEEELTISTPPPISCEDTLVEKNFNFGYDLEEFNDKDESSSILDFNTLLDNDDKEAQINIFLQSNSKQESVETLFQPCNPSSIFSLDRESALIFEDVNPQNHFELKCCPTSICFHDLMVVISADLPPDILGVQIQNIFGHNLLILYAGNIFHWVDPQLFRLLLYKRIPTPSWGESKD